MSDMRATHEEIVRLQAEADQLREDLRVWKGYQNDAVARAAALAEALGFYADERNWINAREIRGFPGFHARASAAKALADLQQAEGVDDVSEHTTQPEIGSLWRDREGNVWRLHRYNDGGPWCQLRGVTRFDGVPFENAHWHCDWLIDLVRKAVPVDA